MTELHEICREVNRIEATEDGEYHLCYRLTKCRTAENDGDIFSITVALLGDRGTEEKTAFDVTRIDRRAEELFALVSENAVTPCTLLEVLSEVL